MSRQFFPVFAALLAAWLCTPKASAQKAADGAASDPAEMALESLFNMQVTTASKFPEKLSGAPGVMSVVTQDDLRRYGAMTVGEALERVPGLITTTSFFTDRSIVAMRGDQAKGNGSHLLFLINGRPSREIQEGGLISDILQSFPVHMLERIEVIRGPGSVLYGTNAFTGVVNLITKKAAGHGQSARFRTFGVERGAGGASGEVLLERGRLQIVAAGQARYDPARRTNYRSEPFDVVLGPRISLQQVSIRDQGPGAYLGLDYRGLRFMGAYSDWQSDTMVRGDFGGSRWRRGFTNLGYTFKPAGNWDMSFDLTHTLARFRAVEFPKISRASSDTVLEWTNIVKLGTRDQVIVGALYNYIEGNELFHGGPQPVPISSGTRTTPGFYGQLEHRLGEDWKLIGGLQANKFGDLALKAVPRAGIIWNPSASRIHVKALYGKAFRAPSINEMRLDHPGLRGNPLLGPENVGTFDLGVSYQANQVLAAVNFFDSRQNGTILGVLQGAGRPQFGNVGYLRARGVELEFKRYFGERVFLHGSLLFNTQSGVQIPTPEWVASSGLSYQNKRSFTLSLSDVYRTEPPGWTAGLNPAPSPFHMVNAHSRFELSRIFGDAARGLSLFAHGVNLTNGQNWLPDLGNSGETVPFGRGRTIYYGLEVAFSRE